MRGGGVLLRDGDAGVENGIKGVKSEEERARGHFLASLVSLLLNGGSRGGRTGLLR